MGPRAGASHPGPRMTPTQAGRGGSARVHRALTGGMCMRQVGIYKTDNATKSVTITPAAFAVRPAADAPPPAQLVAAQ